MNIRFTPSFIQIDEGGRQKKKKNRMLKYAIPNPDKHGRAHITPTVGLLGTPHSVLFPTPVG